VGRVFLLLPALFCIKKTRKLCQSSQLRFCETSLLQPRRGSLASHTKSAPTTPRNARLSRVSRHMSGAPRRSSTSAVHSSGRSPSPAPRATLPLGSSPARPDAPAPMPISVEGGWGICGSRRRAKKTLESREADAIRGWKGLR
jgi:hypothetical protein